jgi:hypothetical protein
MAYTNIDDPSAHFQTALYTGTGAAHSIGNDGNSDLKPDWVWIKKRSATGNHSVFDSTRGAYEELITNGSSAEATDVQLLTQFDTDGFTVGTNSGVNGSGATFVGWQWKANGGTTVSNTDGSITSTVQANQDAGFSIVTWTGNENASATVGHGLGVAPDMWIAKRRNGTYNWQVYTSALAPVGGNNLILALNQSAKAEQVTGTSFTSSSTFQPSSNAKRNSGNMIAYCFNSVQGYSKFGSYVGNGSTSDGVFVYLGFKPAFIITKKTSSTSLWRMYDSKRGAFNLNHQYFFTNAEYEERTNSYGVDFLSNGFKMRNNFSESNYNGETYIYMAFAENPFVTSTGVPTTAR